MSGLVEPMAKPRFGGSECELEAVAAYARAIEDLEQRMAKAKTHETAEHDDGGGETTGAHRRGHAKAKAKGEPSPPR